MKKMVVLLGAGSSIEAGLPSAKEVTNHLENLSSYTAWPKASLVERIFRSLRKVIAVETGTSIDDVDFELVMGALVDAADGLRSPLVRKRIDEVLSPNSAPLDYGRLVRDLTLYLRGLFLSVGAVDYLDPLLDAVLEAQGVIATLNYDVSVERRHSVELKRSLTDGFAEGGRWVGFGNSIVGMELLKLHGSVHWLRRSASFYTKEDVLEHLVLKAPKAFMSALAKPAAWVATEQDPGIRLLMNVGMSKEQLYVTPPFDEIIPRFRAKLSESELIVIVGYSFRDWAVNRMLIESLKDKRAPVVVVDPSVHDLIKARPLLQALDEYRVLQKCSKKISEISRTDMQQWLELNLPKAPTGFSVSPHHRKREFNHRAQDLIVELAILDRHLRLVRTKIESAGSIEYGVMVSLIQTLERCWYTYAFALRAGNQEISGQRPWRLPQPRASVQFMDKGQQFEDVIRQLEKLFPVLDLSENPTRNPQLERLLEKVAESLAMGNASN
jgi:SIR2-like domain